MSWFSGNSSHKKHSLTPSALSAKAQMHPIRIQWKLSYFSLSVFLSAHENFPSVAKTYRSAELKQDVLYVVFLLLWMSLSSGNMKFVVSYEWCAAKHESCGSFCCFINSLISHSSSLAWRPIYGTLSSLPSQYLQYAWTDMVTVTVSRGSVCSKSIIS